MLYDTSTKSYIPFSFIACFSKHNIIIVTKFCAYKKKRQETGISTIPLKAVNSENI